MKYREQYAPRISDFGRDGKLSLGAILCILEDVGCHHSATANDDVLKSGLSGVSWIITNWRIGIRGEAPGGGVLDVCTWSRKRSGPTTVLREFTVTDAAGREIIAAEARFAIWDFNAGGPVRITDALMKAYKSEDVAVFEDELKRPVPPDSFSAPVPVVLRKSDVDYNGHVHNTRYPEIAGEGAELDFFKASEVNIAYRKPLLETDSVGVATAETDNGVFISINNQDGPCCYIELKK